MYKLLYALPSNIEYVGLRKVILGSACASSNIAFLRPVYSILDGKASNIIQYIYIHNCWKKVQTQVHMTWVWTFFNNYNNHPRMCVLSTLCGNVDKHSPFDIYIYIYIYTYILYMWRHVLYSPTYLVCFAAGTFAVAYFIYRDWLELKDG